MWLDLIAVFCELQMVILRSVVMEEQTLFLKVIPRPGRRRGNAFKLSDKSRQTQQSNVNICLTASVREVNI